MKDWGRKFLVAMILLILSSVLLWFGKLNEDSWKQLAEITFITFVGGNSIENLLKYWKR